MKGNNWNIELKETNNYSIVGLVKREESEKKGDEKTQPRINKPKKKKKKKGKESGTSSRTFVTFSSRSVV